MENFEQSLSQVGSTVYGRVFRRLRKLTEQTLLHMRPLIDQRAANGMPRDTHGDLRLEHVYLFPDRAPPDDLINIDCIEFNERFRLADPIADISFLSMDLSFHGRSDLAHCFNEAYVQASGDREGGKLIPLYSSYRAAVRGKVDGMMALDPEMPREDRERALRSSRAHWLLSLSLLEKPRKRPCLVLVSGLPGTGKSTLARGLALAGGFSVISSDVVRKELTGMAPTASARAQFGEGIYSQSWTDRTYAECLYQAERLLFRGERVIVDATFHTERHRRRFLAAARQWCVPCVWLVCRADPSEARSRLLSRPHGPSDASWETHVRMADLWEPSSKETSRVLRKLPPETGASRNVDSAIDVLRREGLLP